MNVDGRVDRVAGGGREKNGMNGMDEILGMEAGGGLVVVCGEGTGGAV